MPLHRFAGSGHEYDFLFAFIAFVNFAGDDMAQQGLADVKRNLVPCFPGQRLFGLCFIHFGHSHMLHQHITGRQTGYYPFAFKRFFCQQFLDITDIPFLQLSRFLLDIMRNFPFSGGNQAQTALGCPQLNHLQTRAAQVDTYGIYFVA